MCEEQNNTWSWPSFELEIVYNWIYASQSSMNFGGLGRMDTCAQQITEIKIFQVWNLNNIVPISLYRALCLEEINIPED